MTISGLGFAATASADEDARPCEQVIPDLTIVNRDERRRLVSVAVETDREPGPQERRAMRIDAGGRWTIDSLSSTLAGRRVRTAVAGEEVVRGLDALRPDRYQRGYRLLIDGGELRAERHHVDLSPQASQRLQAGCSE